MRQKNSDIKIGPGTQSRITTIWKNCKNMTDTIPNMLNPK